MGSGSEPSTTATRSVAVPGRTIVWLLALGAICVGCDYYQGAKQVRTYADMQTICGRLEQARRAGNLSEKAIREAVGNVADGRDAWANEFRWYTRKTSEGISYVLVSYGSDGRADLAESSGYFAMKEETRRLQPQRDVVFRDGLPVTRGAGK